MLHFEWHKRSTVALERYFVEARRPRMHLGIARESEALPGNSHHRIEFAIAVGVMEGRHSVGSGRYRSKRIVQRRERRFDRPINNAWSLAIGKALVFAGQTQADQSARVTQPGDLDLDVDRRGRLRGRGDAEAQSCQGRHR